MYIVTSVRAIDPFEALDEALVHACTIWESRDRALSVFISDASNDNPKERLIVTFEGLT